MRTRKPVLTPYGLLSLSEKLFGEGRRGHCLGGWRY
jgi:hypothetical protein